MIGLLDNCINNRCS